MYSRILAQRDKQKYESDVGARIRTEDIRPGMRCVVRVQSARQGCIGTEYGGIICRVGDKLRLATRRHSDNTTWELPLLLGRDGMLMSTPVPAASDRIRRIEGSSKTATFCSMDESPSRPIGYILGEGFAFAPIDDSGLNEHRYPMRRAA